MQSQTLVVTPSVPMAQVGNRIFLDIKAVEGLKQYAALWPGRVRCLMRQGDRAQIAFGDFYDPADLPFDLMSIGDHLQDSPGAFDDAAVVLAAGDSHLDLAMPYVTTAPTVFVIEYTLDTRLRILRLDHGLSIQTAKSSAWLLLRERDRRRAFSKAAGLQANGTPAFDSYHALTNAPMRYFDTRMPRAQHVTAAEVEAKVVQVLAGRPLRLAYSGRLAKMKGADHLVPIAAALSRSGTPFTLDIYGDGPLRGEIAASVDRAGLQDSVRVHGPVPFDTMLVPRMKESVDLFVCCHRQGDPSCTYIETMSCGVPIVGYDNAAFKGITALGNVGLSVPTDHIVALATAITKLSNDRAQLAGMIRAAAGVSRDHSFEGVFQQRIDHLRTIAQV